MSVDTKVNAFYLKKILVCNITRMTQSYKKILENMELCSFKQLGKSVIGPQVAHILYLVTTARKGQLLVWFSCQL